MVNFYGVVFKILMVQFFAMWQAQSGISLNFICHPFKSSVSHLGQFCQHKKIPCLLAVDMNIKFPISSMVK